MRPTVRLSTTLLFIAAASGAAAEGGPVAPGCLDDVTRDEIAVALPRLMIDTDQLALRRAEAGESGIQVYWLARQTLLIERITRRLAERGDACASASDSVRRDFRMLKVTAMALQDGNDELKIARLEDAGAREALAAILAQISVVEPLLATTD